MTTFTLYRFYDIRGDLLYVGKTINPGRRWREHEKTKDWFNEVVTVKRETFPDAEALDRAERAAIASEAPRYNIALNQRTPKRPKVQASDDLSETLLARWIAIAGEGVTDIPMVANCGGTVDETVCECPRCHESRMVQLDDLRDRFDYSPDILAGIDEVERMYLSGHWLPDWYYDLYDLDWAAPLRVIADSKTAAIPAAANFQDHSAEVECPFCDGSHRHFLSDGANLDAPLEAPCPMFAGGRYVLVEGDLEAIEARAAWAERLSARRSA